MVGSVCAFDCYTYTLNLLCKHTRLVNVGMFEGYAYTLNLLCMRLYFIMYYYCPINNSITHKN